MGYGEKKVLVYERLINFYKQSGNNEGRAEALSEYIVFKDSLFSTQRTKAMTQWETKYATAEKEKGCSWSHTEVP